MRLILASLLVVTILVSACKNHNKITHTEKNADGSTTTTSVDVSDLTNNTDAMNKKMEELKKLTPLTVDQLKGLLPEELNGIKRTSFSANSTMGFAVAEAEYRKDDSTVIKLDIYDCAGEAGAGIYGLNYWTKMNMQSESSDGYTKTFDFMGNKAVETYEKNSNQYTLTFAANDRLLVVLSGRNTGIDALKDAAKSLKLKA
jgi:alpha-L-fucosidase